MSEPHEPIIDACLEEILGEHQAPDLKEQILRALDEQKRRASPEGRKIPPVPAPPKLLSEWAGADAPLLSRVPASLQDSPVADETADRLDVDFGPVESPVPEISVRVAETATAQAARRRRSAFRVGWSLAAAICVLLAAGFWIKSQYDPGSALSPRTLAERGPVDVLEQPARTADDGKAIEDDRGATGPGKDHAIVESPPIFPKGEFNQLPNRSLPGPNELAIPDRPGTSTPAAVPRPREQFSDAEMIALIDRQIEATWNAEDVQPAGAAADGEWVQRIYGRLLGRGPTPAEAESFVELRDRHKKALLVHELLASDECAEHWSDRWASVMLGPGAEPHDSLRDYLRTAWRTGKSYGLVVKELLTAEGSLRPGADDFNPATSFLLTEKDDEGVKTTARICRVLLGIQTQCAQCHDHPLNSSLVQDRFWQMNAFLRQMQRYSVGDGAVGLRNIDFGAAEADGGEAAVFFERPNSLLAAAFPVFLDGTATARSGRMVEVDRRQELAKFVLQAPEFAQATTNRVWEEMFGFGFTQPVDDMGTHNPPSHPLLLEGLAREFSNRDFDFKSLIGWIAMSQAFGLKSGMHHGSLLDNPGMGTPALFSYYYQPLATPSPTDESLRAIAAAREAGRPPNVLAQPDPSLSPPNNIGQETTVRLRNGDPTGVFARIVGSRLSFDQKVTHLFLAALDRPPQEKEKLAVAALQKADNGSLRETLDDLWLGLQNCREFSLAR